MLNAKELVKAVKDAKNEPTEEQGEARSVAKLLDWDGLYRDPETEARVTSLLQPLAQPRVSVKSCLSEAVWDEAKGRVVITRSTSSKKKLKYWNSNISGTLEEQSWDLFSPRRLSFSWRTTVFI